MPVLSELRTKGFDCWARDRFHDPLLVFVAAEAFLIVLSWLVHFAFGRSLAVDTLMGFAVVWAVPFAYFGRRLSFEYDTKAKHVLAQYRVLGGQDPPEHPPWWNQEPHLWHRLARPVFRLVGALGLVAWLPMYLGWSAAFAVFWAGSLGALLLIRGERRAAFVLKVRALLADADAARGALHGNIVRLEERLVSLNREVADVEQQLTTLREMEVDPTLVPAQTAFLVRQSEHQKREDERREREAATSERRGVFRDYTLFALGLVLGLVLAIASHRAGVT